MAKRIYVGNLPATASEKEIKLLFSRFGSVASVELSTDRTGLQSFGFVEMTSGGDKAIEALHQTEMGGKQLNVNEARPRTE